MINLLLGKCTKVIDKKRLVIKFQAQGVIEEDCKAFPIDTFDEPEEGCEVILYEIETVFGYSYLWKKLRLFDHTRLQFNDSLIDIHDNYVEIHTSKGNQLIKLDKDKGEIQFQVGDSIINLSDTGIKIQGSVTTQYPNGTVVPDPKGGPYCCVPVCPLSGLPHQGTIFTKSNKIISKVDSTSHSDNCDCLSSYPDYSKE